jgi:predicted TIM-barrel fold metal-dependent hydrolase
MPLDRRTVLKGMAAGILAAGIPGHAESPVELPGIYQRYRIWDVHSHLEALSEPTPEERIETLVTHMDRLGVERLILSQGFGEYISHPTPEQMRIENDRVLRAAKRFPDRVYGSVYLTPDHVQESLEEFDRCVKDGPMVCVGEVQTDLRCNHPNLDPIVERAAALRVPILQHTWIKTTKSDPGESTPYDLVELAKRHPEAQFICGHTGGTWELGIRIIRDVPNISTEIAGSDPTAGFVEMAVRELGAERVIYGSDVGGRSFASQMAKVIGAEIPEDAKKLILGGNLRRLLQPILKAKGLPS